jgi:hypothetical protein
MPMINYYKHQDIDKKKWDFCVENSLNTSYAALSDVLDITATHWDGLVYGDYIAVFPLPWRKKHGLKYIYPPFFTAQLGLFTMEELDIALFFQAIPKEFKFVEIVSNNYFKTPGFVSVFKRNKTFRLGLMKNYEELSANFSKNHKQNIRKANQAGLTMTKQGSIQPIIDLFRENKGFVSAFKSADYEVLHQLMAHLCTLGKAEIWSVYDETNTLCAGGFFVYDFNKITFIFSGSNEVAKDRRAMFFLFDQFLKEHAETNVILDFCGSNDDNLARFYKGFGSTLYFYDTIRMGKTVGVVNWFRSLKKMIRF